MQLGASQDGRSCMKGSLWEKKLWLFYEYKSDNIDSYAARNILLRPRICAITGLFLGVNH